MQILNLKTYRSHSSDYGDRTIRVEKTYIHISKAAETFLNLTENDRFSFFIDKDEIYFKYDANDGFPVKRKSYDNRFYIHNSQLCRIMQTHGKLFIIDKFKFSVISKNTFWNVVTIAVVLGPLIRKLLNIESAWILNPALTFKIVFSFDNPTKIVASSKFMSRE